MALTPVVLTTFQDSSKGSLAHFIYPAVPSLAGFRDGLDFLRKRDNAVGMEGLEAIKKIILDILYKRIGRENSKEDMAKEVTKDVDDGQLSVDKRNILVGLATKIAEANDFASLDKAIADLEKDQSKMEILNRNRISFCRLLPFITTGCYDAIVLCRHFIDNIKPFVEVRNHALAELKKYMQGQGLDSENVEILWNYDGGPYIVFQSSEFKTDSSMSQDLNHCYLCLKDLKRELNEGEREYVRNFPSFELNVSATSIKAPEIRVSHLFELASGNTTDETELSEPGIKLVSHRS